MVGTHHGNATTKHMYSTCMYNSLLINVSVSLIVSEVLPHMAPALTHISMYIKHMPPFKDKFQFILVILCEVSNFTVPMKTATAPEICDALMNSFIEYSGTPIRIVCDQDPAFMSHLTLWFLHSYGIHVTTASPTNHQSLMAEHDIKGLANILMKHLTDFGDNWPLYCKPAMLVYNLYATPNLDNLSPFEVAMSRKAVLAPSFEYNPSVPITGTHAKVHENLQEKLLYFKNDWRHSDPK